MSFRLVDSGWGRLLNKALQADHSCLRIVSPFIKFRAVSHLLEHRYPTSLEVITRYDLNGFVDGVSDLTALRLLLQKGAHIRGVRNLHAKVYLVGSQCAIVTSANLTEQGLERNHEFGFCAGEAAVVQSCRDYFESLWKRAGADLSVDELSQWETEVAKSLACGAGTRPRRRLRDNGIHYYAFDILVHKNKDLTQLPLSKRREILYSVVKQSDHIDLSAVSDKSAKDMLTFVKKVGLEGVVAKRAESIYEPGKRTGQWSKYRINLGQEFVIGGYIPSNLGLDSLVIGFYRGKDLYYAARVRAGFVPATRRTTFEAIKHLKIAKCPFVNLPEKEAGRWGQGLTAEKMKECVWLKPEAVGRIDFLEWTGADHLRHTKFVGLRDDKDPKKVVRET